MRRGGGGGGGKGASRWRVTGDEANLTPRKYRLSEKLINKSQETIYIQINCSCAILELVFKNNSCIMKSQLKKQSTC